MSQGAWVAPAGRPDAIDEIADQFERPAEAPLVLESVPLESGHAAFWWSIELQRSAPAHGAAASFAPRTVARTIERRAG